MLRTTKAATLTAVALSLFLLSSSHVELSVRGHSAVSPPPAIHPPLPDESPQMAAPIRSSSPLGDPFPAPPASLTLTFGTTAVSSYVRNWLRHARRHPALLPYAAVALDDEIMRLCRTWGEPVLEASVLLAGDAAGEEALRTLGGGYVRDRTASFKQLGYLKALATAQLLELGYDVLLSDADAVWLGDPWPWIGRAGVPVAADAGELPRADVLATNDLPDLRRDGQPDSVYNTGVTFFRASPDGRARRFALEWANRTKNTGVIGNDQTEFNRLLRNRYIDGDYTCNRPECLAPDPQHFVPTASSYRGQGCAKEGASEGANEEANEGVDGVDGRSAIDQGPGQTCAPCHWLATRTGRDSYTGLESIAMGPADVAWRRCDGLQRAQRRAPVRTARRTYWLWGGRVRFGLLPMDRFLQGHTFFVQRLHALRGVQPLHVHVTYTMGSDLGSAPC